uniref:Prostate and testis expressed 1 n=2 Tax=Neovison vison TaxID=452646 RepID=A0A8C7C286_NEOVI
MDKPLLLGLSILFGCIRSESLGLVVGEIASHFCSWFLGPMTDLVQCRMCHLQFPGERCSRGRGVCTATEDEGCLTGRIFKKDGTLWLTFMGCLENCANVDKIKWSVYLVTFRCCRVSDLCNENL